MASKILLYCIIMGSADLIYPPYEEQHGKGAVFWHILETQQSQRHIWGGCSGSQREGGKGGRTG